MRLGGEIADLALAAFADAGRQEISSSMTVSYGEFETLAGKVGQFELCPTPRAGVALIGGAEDGRSSWFGRFGIREGNPLPQPRGCHGHKRLAFPPLQPILLRRSSFPARMPLHQIRFGGSAVGQPDLILASVPGEPTVTVGRRLAKELAGGQETRVSVLAHANALSLLPRYA